jgi:hypothetical protein
MEAATALGSDHLDRLHDAVSSGRLSVAFNQLLKAASIQWGGEINGQVGLEQHCDVLLRVMLVAFHHSQSAKSALHCLQLNLPIPSKSTLRNISLTWALGVLSTDSWRHL